MSSLATIGQPPSKPAATATTGSPPRRRNKKWRWLVAFLLATVICLGALAYPPVWQGILRSLLTWEAARQGCELRMDAMAGGPFGTMRFDGVHLRQRGSAADESNDAAKPGTDLFIAHAQVNFAWRLPGFRHADPSLVRQLTLEGVSGRCDLAASAGARGPQASSSPESREWLYTPAVSRFLQRKLARLSPRLVPTNFSVQADDLLLRRNRYQLRTIGLQLTGARDGAGQMTAREVRASGPGFASTFAGWRGQTFWKGTRLTLAGLELGNGMVLTSATLDGSHLARRRLDWECRSTALGGEIRGQGTIDFSRERLGLEVAATLRKTALGPLARMLGIPGPVDGQVEQASFTFRGELESWASAQMWLSGRATDFEWNTRRWQSLETQVMLVNRRVQIHRLELRQSRNSLSLSGECPLPPETETGLTWTGRVPWWQAAGFSCNLDARLDDLRALTQLVGSRLPELDGRMSINGKLGAASGHAEIEGYLNVEGTRLKIHGAPLDYLRSTLLFRGGELEVADLQATQDADYFTSHGVIGLAGAPRYQGELRAEIKDVGIYTPTLADLPWMDKNIAAITGLRAVLRLEDSVLQVDQCEGKQAGEPFQISGSVDLREAAHAMPDLHINGTLSLGADAPAPFAPPVKAVPPDTGVPVVEVDPPLR